jgi:lipopolysaccharide/colanic/teichoic acid biosynthesis glycosyltransferase
MSVTAVTPPGTSEESLATRYARIAGTVEHPRRVDVLLRGLDVLIAGTLLVLTAPVMGAVAVAIRLLAGRPILYRGQRVGRAGEPFEMLKFRTLRPNAEARLGPFTGHDLDRRAVAEMTAIGRLLRRGHLDELPQLWNVLQGDMAIVGPRPIRPIFFEQLCAEIPQYWQRLVVRPGMTGPAQLRMERGMSWSEKLAHDLEYIADRSVRLYLRTVVATAWRVFSRTATVHRPEVEH